MDRFSAVAPEKAEICQALNNFAMFLKCSGENNPKSSKER